MGLLIAVAPKEPVENPSILVGLMIDWIPRLLMVMMILYVAGFIGLMITCPYSRSQMRNLSPRELWFPTEEFETQRYRYRKEAKRTVAERNRAAAEANREED